MLPQREKVRLGSDLERWVRIGAPILPRWDGAGPTGYRKWEICQTQNTSIEA